MPDTNLRKACENVKPIIQQIVEELIASHFDPYAQQITNEEVGIQVNALQMFLIDIERAEE